MSVVINRTEDVQGGTEDSDSQCTEMAEVIVAAVLVVALV